MTIVFLYCTFNGLKERYSIQALSFDKYFAYVVIPLKEPSRICRRACYYDARHLMPNKAVE